VNRIVLDASAILAVIGAEPGQETLDDEVLSHAIASTVNVAEVLRAPVYTAERNRRKLTLDIPIHVIR
jgi:PIN domain nuclease of toxin-antitoxin system